MVALRDGHDRGLNRLIKEARRAEDLAERCFGVQDVHNRIRVEDAAPDVHIGKASE